MTARKPPVLSASRRSALACACLITLLAEMAIAGELQITLREMLNQEYGRELLCYPFAAPEKQCIVGSIMLVGPAGQQAVQLADAEYWPDGTSVKSARIVFIADALAKLETRTYRYSYGTTPAAAARSSLTVNAEAETVMIDTGSIAARFLLGNKEFEKPVAAKTVPGPISGLRLANGVWDGGSQLYGEELIKGYSARLVASGPVFAQVEFKYVMEDDSTVVLKAQLFDGDAAVRWSMDSRCDRPETGMEFLLAKMPALKEVSYPRSFGIWSQSLVLPVTPGQDAFFRLGPKTSVCSNYPERALATLSPAGGPVLHLCSRNAENWVEAARPFTYSGFESWNLEMIPPMWDVWKRKLMPVSLSADSTVSIKAGFASGKRAWSICNSENVLSDTLNRVKDCVLAWPDTKGSHPYLFMSRAEMEAARAIRTPDPERKKYYATFCDAIYMAMEGYLYAGQDAEYAGKLKLLQHLKNYLSKSGDFDTMRYGNAVATLYDAIIDTDLVQPDERPVLRAQMAYLAYRIADPITWSTERGYCSGNPNMSVSYILTLGTICCLIPDHPMAKTWNDYASTWMDRWLSSEVGPNGEWGIEGLHYGQVSLTPMIAYAIASKRAGFRDFTDDPRLKKAALYFAKHWTPADPRRNNFRVSPPIGRGTCGETASLFGVMARMTAEKDPEYSKVMQWMWKAQAPTPITMGDWRMGGFELLYIDNALPAQRPEWTSELFPQLGAIMRSGVGETDEHCINLLSSVDALHNLDVWVPEIGGISSWYARGKPVSQSFGFSMGYADRHELLRDGVYLARNWDGNGNGKLPFGHYVKTALLGFASLPQTDYCCSHFTNTKTDGRDWFPDKLPAWPAVKAAAGENLEWTRQALFMKDKELRGPHYLILRDTTDGGQPTCWQFRSLSERIGTPEQAKDAAFLADKPGPKAVPARELPQGKRYTAAGQFDVDLEYFIASPENTPRSTMRYGGIHLQDQVVAFQDFLHLQLSGDGSYYVAIFPRTRDEAAPSFNNLADGMIIKVAGAFGTDYAYLAKEECQAAAEGAGFKGTAGAVQERPNSLMLNLCAKGEIRYREYVLSATLPACLEADGRSMKLRFPVGNAGGDVTVSAGAGWKLETRGIAAEQKQVDIHHLVIPAGTKEIVFGK